MPRVGKLFCLAVVMLAACPPVWAESAGLVGRLEDWGLPAWLITVVIAMLPVIELRGAIPVAHLVLGMPIFPAAALSVLGNLAPVAPVILFLGPASRVLARVPLFGRFFEWLFARTRSRSDLVKRYQMVGLMLFVAVPLPMTGAWTGAVAAFLFGIGFWPAMLFISLGVLIAALIVTSLVLMGIWGAIIAGTALCLTALLASWRALKKGQDV